MAKLFEFRRYKKKEGGVKKKKHPKLIVDENKNYYGFMGLTSSSKRGHHANLRLVKNPKKGKAEHSYLRTEVRYDEKKNFSEALKDYHLSKEDEKAVIEFLKKRKRK